MLFYLYKKKDIEKPYSNTKLSAPESLINILYKAMSHKSTNKKAVINAIGVLFKFDKNSCELIKESINSVFGKYGKSCLELILKTSLDNTSLKLYRSKINYEIERWLKNYKDKLMKILLV